MGNYREALFPSLSNKPLPVLPQGSRARQKVVAVSGTTLVAVTDKLNAVAREGVE